MRLPSYVKGPLVLLGVLLFCFLLGEGMVRLYLTRHTVYDVEMSRYAMKMKRDAGDPRIGHVHHPGASARLMDVEVRINSDGLRDREYSPAKGDRYRIAVLGDSLTFGWGVEKADTFEERLEARLSASHPVEVINFAAGNYNTEQEVHVFLRKGPRYDPDHVVLFYFINDAEPTPEQSGLWFLGYSRMVTLYWSRGRGMLSRWGSGPSFKEYYSRLYHADQPGWVRGKEAFRLLHRTCLDEGIELQVVLLPELHELREYGFAQEHRLVMDFLDQEGIECLDLAPVFEDCTDPVQYWVALDDAHPNARAHARIAEGCNDFIARKLAMHLQE